MKESTQKIISIFNFALVFVFIAGFMLKFAANRNAPAPRPKSAQQQQQELEEYKESQEAARQCGIVVERCEAAASLGLPTCDRKLAMQRLGDLLKDASATPPCESARERLNSGCAEGCYVDVSSIFPLTGAIQFDIPQQPSEDGSCFVSGTREVTYSADCMRRQ